MIDERAVVGSWPLQTDADDASDRRRPAVAIGELTFGPSSDPAAARSVLCLEPGSGRLEVPGIRLGIDDFTLTAWVRAAAPARTSLGDVAAMFDSSTRRGFSLGLHHSASCGNHGNDRNLFFGIDAGTAVEWTEHGRPSPATIMVCALAVHEGMLYAGTWESGPSPRGHVFRLDSGGWVSCGSPWDANAVTRLTVHDGRLYAGASRLRGGGSGMPDSANQGPGGHVLRYDGGESWTDLGALPGADSIAGLVPFDGDLYAIPMYSEGVFRFDPGGRWIDCGTPGRRLLALGVHAGALYGAGNDHADVVSAIAQTAAGIVVPARSAEGGGGMFRYAGSREWTALGLQPDTTQVYSIETWDRHLVIGTWPNGLVFRHVEGRWEPAGRLGDDTEVMNLLAYNGKLYGGTLPGAGVYRLDGDDAWTCVGTVDRTPDVLYRRAASMAVYRGRLFCGTLPSGTVHSMSAGSLASHDTALATGWRHVAAVRSGPSVTLYVDGAIVAQQAGSTGSGPLDLGAPGPLVIGGGPRGGFEGEIADLRLDARALDPREIAQAAASGLS